MKRFLTLMTVALWSWLMPAQAQSPSQDPSQATARFDRQTVFEGDSVVLRIEISNARVEEEPDFSPLENDFLIGQTGTNSSMSIINGRREFRTEWNVLLEPRRSGEIQVPSLTIGSYRTQPLTLTVMTRPQGSGPDGRDVFLEVEATPEDPYVHAQVLFIIRLYHAPSIMEGSLGEPAGVDAVVERLGDDTDYRTVVDGQNYRVIERRYALFPERSGALQIPAIRFQGRVADRSQRGQGFNSLFSRGRLTSVKSDPLTLEVRPRPSSYTGTHWLPASAFELKEVWPNGEPEFRVGEPVTRTLVTEARGLLSAQLPEYVLAVPEGVKVYPDQPVSQSRSDGAWVLGRREDRFAIVPTRPGPMLLPSIEIPWWDTVNNRAAVAVIPAHEYNVLPPAEGQMATAPGLPAVDEPAMLPLEVGAAPGSAEPWRLVALIALMLWMITLALYLRQRKVAGRAPDQAPSQSVNRTTPREAIVPLRKACQTGDAHAAARALLAVPGPDAPVEPRSLGELARHLGDVELAREIEALDRVLYHDAEARWDGDRLWDLARRGFTWRSDAPAPDHGALPPLYPPRH